LLYAQTHLEHNSSICDFHVAGNDRCTPPWPDIG
jgi:hypothetical protein